MLKKSQNPQISYDEKLKEKAKQLRNYPTPAEKKFWNVLRTMPFYRQYSFNRQKPLGGFIVDFYCHSLGLVIEIDGDTHGTDQAQSYDQRRTRWLERKGLEVIRFSNDDVFNRIHGAMKILEKMIEKRTKEKSSQPPS